MAAKKGGSFDHQDVPLLTPLPSYFRINFFLLRGPSSATSVHQRTPHSALDALCFGSTKSTFRLVAFFFSFASCLRVVLYIFTLVPLARARRCFAPTQTKQFTTLTAVPGTLNYRGAKIQMLDLPGIIEGAKDGKGRGRQVYTPVMFCGRCSWRCCRCRHRCSRWVRWWLCWSRWKVIMLVHLRAHVCCCHHVSVEYFDVTPV